MDMDCSNRGQSTFQMLVFLLYLPFGLMIQLPWYASACAATHETRDRQKLIDFLLVSFCLLLIDHNLLDGMLEYRWKDVEPWAINMQAKQLHTRMFVWLLQTSSNPSARSVAIARLSTSLGGPEVLRLVQPPITSNQSDTKQW